MTKEVIKDSELVEVDGSNLPPNLFGLSIDKPFRPETDRTTYRAIDTGEFSIYSDNQWFVVENRCTPKS